MKREATFQRYFQHYLKGVMGHVFVFKLPDVGYQTPFDSFSVDAQGKFYAWELKQTTTESLPFISVVPHQITALEIVKGSVVIRYPQFFCLIPIDIFIQESKRSKRRSLTSERAKEIATLVVKI